MFSTCRLITTVPLLLAVITGAQGRLTVTPRDSVVLIGDTNVFTCCSDDTQTSITWKRKPVGLQSEEEIYHLGGLINGYRTNGRYNVASGSKPGCYSLTTTNVSLGDEGMYTCIDNAGLGHSRGWELVILESFDCQEKNGKADYMGENYFGLQQDVISMVCFFKYYGIVRPKLMCEWSSGTQLYDNYQFVTETIANTTVIIQIPARKELNGHYLTCYAKIEEVSTIDQSSSTWKSDKLRVNYAYFQQKVVSQCNDEDLSLDCQPPCNYKMKKFDNGSSYCEITYPVQPARTFSVLLKETRKEWALYVAIAAGSVVITLVLTAIILLVVCCCKKAHRLEQIRRTMVTGFCRCDTGHSENNNCAAEVLQSLSGDPTAKQDPPSYLEQL